MKEKRLQENAQLRILEMLAKHGPSHMYPFHEASSKSYIASRMTVNRAKSNLLKQGLITLMREESHSGQDKKIYSLTLKGLHYTLRNTNYPKSEGYKTLVKNGIQVPILDKKELFSSSLLGTFDMRAVLNALNLNKLKEYAIALMREYPQDFFSKMADVREETSDIDKVYAPSFIMVTEFVFSRKYDFEKKESLVSLIFDIAKPLYETLRKQLDKPLI